MTDQPKCADLLRTLDWSETSLGPYEQWPKRLQGYAEMVIEMPVPAIIFWGPNQLQIYNDGYSVIMGPRHPRYFGRSYAECWPDTYPVIYPWMQRVLEGEVVSVERTLFVLTRHGFTEEAYFTFTFSPLRDDSGAIGGIIQPVVEVTQEVLAVRRTKTLQGLKDSETLDAAIATLAANGEDIPFACLYVAGDDRLRASPGILPIDERIRAAVTWERSKVVETRDVLAADHLGGWGEPTRSAYVVPLRRWPGEPAQGVLAIGLSPRLRFEEVYHEFLDAAARELSSQLEAARAREAADALQVRADAAAALAETERRRLHSVFENAPVAITMLTGPDYRIELANPRMCEIWGRPLDQVRGRPIFEAIPEVAGRGPETSLDEVRRSGQPYIAVDARIPLVSAADGQLHDRYFNFVYEPMREGESVASIIVVAADVTELKDAQRASERASRAKDEFLAMLGHELRNPLAPIFTAVELWKARASDPGSTRLRDIIERQAHHLSMLVDDLLDVSRITQGKVELAHERVSIEQVVSKAVETVSPLIEKRRHHLAVNVDAMLYVFGDPARLVQVFANLLTNAAKYTEAGGKIAIAVRREGSEVVTTVADTGKGIAPDVLPYVFDLFVQERQSSDRSLGGLGIGLSIVRNLVAMHGGRIEARSEGLGCGSTFTVRLPLAAAPEDARPAAEPDHTERRDRVGTVLVIDDNEDAALLLCDMLDRMGYACRSAHDGPSGLAIASGNTFDAMLIDIGLPAMDGYEVARQVRRMYGEDVRLVAVTGYGQPDDRRQALAAGFDEHLVKPVDANVLRAVLPVLASPGDVRAR
jgi:PAS domain S-box-containing protein